MTSPIVVGYTATSAGRDAVAVGRRLAASTGAELHLVLVLPSAERSVITPPQKDYDRHLLDRATEWLAEALVGSADRSQVRVAESFAAGLVEAARDLDASHIVVGAANSGLRGGFLLGAVATELLHSSTVPVVLAPVGSAELGLGPVSRVTAAVGMRPGGETVLTASVLLAEAAEAPLRLVSLVAVDLPSGFDAAAVDLAASAHVAEVLETARRALPPTVVAEAVVAEGRDVQDAAEGMSWQPDEVLVVGSSRLARPRRVFFGSTAAAILHVLRVPMIVVPRPAKQKGRR